MLVIIIGCMSNTESSYKADKSLNPSKGRLAREMMMERKQQHYDDLIQSRLENPQPRTQAVGAVSCINSE